MERQRIFFVVLLCGLMCLPAFLPGEVTLNGQVTLLYEHGVPVGFVKISAHGAHVTQSDTSGLFTLRFPNCNPGDSVVLVVEKKGFEVVNRKELNLLLPSDPNYIYRILMCRRGERNEYARRYHGIAEDVIRKKYAQALEEITHLKLDKAELNRRLSQLANERDAALTNSKAMSETFADVDLTRASAMYREAFEYFRNAEIDRAWAVLDDVKMAEALASAREGKRMAKDALKQSREAILKIAKTYKLKGDLAVVQLKFAEAEKYFLLACDAAPGDFGIHSAVISYLFAQNQFRMSASLAGKALAAAAGPTQRATILKLQGNLFCKINRFADAEAAYKEALKTYRSLAEQSPGAYTPDVAATLNNLGNLYCITIRFTDAQVAYREALKTYRSLARQNRIIYSPDVAKTLNNLGNLYLETIHFKEAEAAYREALDIRRSLAGPNPGAYRPNIASILNNLGSLYADTTRFAQAEAAYKNALETYRSLAKQNPDAYRPYVANTLNNLGTLYLKTSRFAEAKVVYTEALDTYCSLVEQNPDAYLANVTSTVNNLGNLYLKSDRFTEAEGIYKNALKIYRSLANRNPGAYRPDVATVLNNLGFLYILGKKLKEAESVLREALEIREALIKFNPHAFEIDYCSTLVALSKILSPKEARRLQERAIKILEKYPEVPQARKYLDAIKKMSKNWK